MREVFYLLVALLILAAYSWASGEDYRTATMRNATTAWSVAQFEGRQ